MNNIAKACVALLLPLFMLTGSASTSADTESFADPRGREAVLTYSFPEPRTQVVAKWNYNARLFGMNWDAYKLSVQPSPQDLAYTDMRFLGSRFRQVIYYWGAQNERFLVEGNTCHIGPALYGLRLDDTTTISELVPSSTLQYLEIDRVVQRAECESLVTLYPNLRIINLCVESSASDIAFLCSSCPVTYIHWEFFFRRISPLAEFSGYGFEKWCAQICGDVPDWLAEFLSSCTASVSFDHFSFIGEPSVLKQYSSMLSRLTGLWYLGDVNDIILKLIEEDAPDLEALLLVSSAGVLNGSGNPLGIKIRYFYGGFFPSHDIASPLIACAANEEVFERIVNKKGLGFCRLFAMFPRWGLMRDFTGLKQFTGVIHIREVFGDRYPESLSIMNVYSLWLSKKEDFEWLCTTAREVNVVSLGIYPKKLGRMLVPSRIRNICVSRVFWNDDPYSPENSVYEFLWAIRPSEGFKQVLIPGVKSLVSGATLVFPARDEFHQVFPVRVPFFHDAFRLSDYLQGLPFVTYTHKGGDIELPSITGVRMHLRRE